MRGKQLNAFEKGQADAWSAEGVSHREIARRLKCHHATIGRFLKRFKATGDFKQLKGRGRKRKTSARDDRFIERRTTTRGSAGRLALFTIQHAQQPRGEHASPLPSSD